MPSVRAPRASGAAPAAGGAASPTKRGPGSPTKGQHAAPPPIPLVAPSVKDRIAALAGAYAAQPAPVVSAPPPVPPKKTGVAPREAGLRQSRDGSPTKVPPLAPPPATTARRPSPSRSPVLTSVEPALGDPVEVALPAPPTPMEAAPSGPGDFADLLEAATAAEEEVVVHAAPSSFDTFLAQPRNSHVSAPAPRVSFLAQALLDEDQMGVALALTGGNETNASSADPAAAAAADAPDTSFRPRRSSTGLSFTPATGAGRMQRISGVFDTNTELAPPLPPRVSRASHARVSAATGAALLDLMNEDGEAEPFRGGARASSSTGMGRRPRRSRSTEPAPTRKSMATAPLVLQSIPSGAEATAATLMDDDGTAPPPPPAAAFSARSSTGDTVAGMLPSFPAPSSSMSSRPMTAPVGRPRPAAPAAGPPVSPTRRDFALMALDVPADPEADLLEGERTWQGPALPPPAPSASSWMEAQTHSLNTTISNMAQWVCSPGPAGAANCHVRREKLRGGDAFTMYLEGPNKDHIPGNPLDARLLLFARRTRGGIAGRGSCYRITTEPYDTEGPHKGKVVGTLSSNFLGTEFIGCDQQGRHMLAVTYNVNVLGAAGPRKMVVSAALPGSALPDGAVLQAARSEHRAPGTALLTAKAPRWNAALQSYCLNFHGRVACASVKNFQLTTERDAKLPRPTVQFGKVQSDLFTLDYVGPISALESFMLALASCDNKLACG